MEEDEKKSKLGEFSQKALEQAWKKVPLKWKVYIIGGAGILLVIIVVIIVFLGSFSSYNDISNYANTTEGSFTCSMGKPIKEDLVTADYVGRNYCYGTSDDGKIINEGIILIGKVGDEVISVADGVVSQVTDYSKNPTTTKKSGYSITISHEAKVNGYTSIYDDLSSVNVNLNDQVSKGTTVGVMGSSGDTNLPHTTFKIKEYNTFIDINKLFNFEDNKLSCVESAVRFTSRCTIDYAKLGENAFICNMSDPFHFTTPLLTNDPFGWRIWPLNESITKEHSGVDLSTGCGTEVYAVQAGTVTLARFRFSWGNSVIIDHGSGYQTTYNHLSSINVSMGQTVDAGTIIGLVGSTGDSTGCHLHFEIIKDNVKTSPNMFFGILDKTDDLCLSTEQPSAERETEILNGACATENREKISYETFRALCEEN